MTDQRTHSRSKPDILDRWKLIAEQLGDDGAGLRLQLDDIEAAENSFDTLTKAAQGRSHSREEDTRGAQSIGRISCSGNRADRFAVTIALEL